MSKARDFVDFWVLNSVHAAEQFRVKGASQNISELAQRCVEAAKAQGISEDDIKAEVGDVSQHIRDRLIEANRIERDRRKPN